MEVAAAIGAGIVIVVVSSFALRRRASREAHSVAGYRQTLDVLGRLGDAERGGRRLGPPGDSPRPPAHDRPRVATPSSYDALATEGRPRATAALGEPATRRDRSLLVMDRPARRLGMPIAVLVLVLAAAGAAAYLVVRAHHVTHPPRTSANSHSHSPATTVTTVPPRYVAVSSTSTSATYAPATPTYSLTLGATTSDCWMSVTSASGTTVLAQTFAAGASTSLSLTCHSTIVLGAPKSAKLSIGGVPVALPSALAGPFTVTLSPS